MDLDFELLGKRLTEAITSAFEGTGHVMTDFVLGITSVDAGPGEQASFFFAPNSSTFHRRGLAERLSEIAAEDTMPCTCCDEED